MANVHILVCDLDGTLFVTGTNDADPKDIEAVRNWKKCGNEFWVATGRGLNCKQTLTQYGITPDAIVYGAGTGYQIGDQKPQLIGYIPEDLAGELFHVLDTECAQMDYFLDAGAGNLSYGSADAGAFRRKFGEDFRELSSPYDFLRNEDRPLFRVFSAADSNAEMEKAAAVINRHFAGRLVPMKTDTACLDIIPAACSKWNGEKAVLDVRGLSADECASIGDQPADAGMIQNSGIGFAMAAADESVRRVADYVVHSVAEAIEILETKRGLKQ